MFVERVIISSLCHQGFLVHHMEELLPSVQATSQRTPTGKKENNQKKLKIGLSSKFFALCVKMTNHEMSTLISACSICVFLNDSYQIITNIC